MDSAQVAARVEEIQDLLAAAARAAAAGEMQAVRVWLDPVPTLCIDLRADLARVMSPGS